MEARKMRIKRIIRHAHFAFFAMSPARLATIIVRRDRTNVTKAPVHALCRLQLVVVNMPTMWTYKPDRQYPGTDHSVAVWPCCSLGTGAVAIVGLMGRLDPCPGNQVQLSVHVVFL
jgi:hypothetical protein